MFSFMKKKLEPKKEQSRDAIEALGDELVNNIQMGVNILSAKIHGLEDQIEELKQALEERKQK